MCTTLGDQLPPLSREHVWLVAQMFEGEDMTGDQVFYTIDGPVSSYQCRVPELLGRRIQGCFHGWVILSDHPHSVMWSLWNPPTSKFIRLPPLNILKEGYINECFLSLPPGDRGSVLLLTIEEKPVFVFCRLDRKRKRLRWSIMSYDKQLKNITGKDNGFLHSLTCCNDKVYALNWGFKCDKFIIEIDIVVNDKETVISILPFVKLPSHKLPSGPIHGLKLPILKASCSGLFIIYRYIKYCVRMTPFSCVRMVKLDMTRKLWDDMEDLDDGICFLGLDYNVPFVTSELGDGYIHMFCEVDKVIYSYNVKDQTLAISSMPYVDFPPQTSYVSVWTMPKCRLEGDHGEINHMSEVKSMVKRHDESQLLNIPFHLLEMIMEFCVDIDYANFRATCKKLTAPVTQWSNGASFRRLPRYSLVSPWLMVLDENQGIITFTDPMFGDQYSARTPPELAGDLYIWCSMYGWLLMSKGTENMILFNPFTSHIHKLPNLEVYFFRCFSFSAPPSSPDCMVVGFCGLGVDIHFVAREPPSWLSIGLDFGVDQEPSFFHFSTCCGQEMNALDTKGRLSIFTDLWDKDDYSWVEVDVAPTTCCKSWAHYSLAKRDQDLLLVVVGEFGVSIELFKLNLEDRKWEKIDGLGKYMIYICDTTCLCMEARVPEMENKIYFARLHSENGKIVYYSLDTCLYHTFSGKSIVEGLSDFFGTKEHLHLHTWIEPNYA